MPLPNSCWLSMCGVACSGADVVSALRKDCGSVRVEVEVEYIVIIFVFSAIVNAYVN